MTLLVKRGVSRDSYIFCIASDARVEACLIAAYMSLLHFLLFLDRQGAPLEFKRTLVFCELLGVKRSICIWRRTALSIVFTPFVGVQLLFYGFRTCLFFGIIATVGVGEALLISPPVEPPVGGERHSSRRLVSQFVSSSELGAKIGRETATPQRQELLLERRLWICFRV